METAYSEQQGAYLNGNSIFLDYVGKKSTFSPRGNAWVSKAPGYNIRGGVGGGRHFGNPSDGSKGNVYSISSISLSHLTFSLSKCHFYKVSFVLIVNSKNTDKCNMDHTLLFYL